MNNPKIDLFYNDKYVGSTNLHKTINGALEYFRNHGMNLTKGVIDHGKRY